MSGAGSVLDLSLGQLGLALLLVGVVIAISAYQGLGIGRDLVVGSLRAVVQLYLVGLILAVVFQAAQWYWVLLMLAVMTAVAAQAATSRLARPMPRARAIAALALTVSTAVTLAYVIGVIVQARPWYEPQYIIPIAGMILGSAMTSAALAGDRLQGDLRVRADEVEARLALGFSGREAVQPMARTALRAAMIPTVNGMMTVGLVQLPGMLGGQEDGASCHLEVGQELAKHFLGAGTLVVDRLGHACGEAIGKFQLGHGPDSGLVREIFDDAGIPDAVVEVDSTVQEQALPGHLDIVEDDEGVLLVEAGRQRPVERMRSRSGRAVPAQEDESRRVDGYGESQSVGVGVGRDRQTRIDCDLVGEGRERRENPRPAHDDAGGGLPHLVQGDSVPDNPAVGHLVNGGVDDGVSE